jgi:hypothetical protein
MAEIISSRIPVFAGFRDVFKAGGTSRLILAAMPAERIPEAHRLIERLLEVDTKPGTGVSFAVPITAALGLEREVIEED